ncbi:MAG: DUF4282 domain-containing protein [Chloroflexi bacterium]|nr:DUF4282 domain-containing protein [Chloroflexota bacterium]
MNKTWKDYLTFRRMITPVIIQIVFWVGVAAVLIGGAVAFFSGLITGVSNADGGAIFAALIGVPLLTVLGLVAVRVYTELLIVFFRINDNLKDIRDALVKDEEGEIQEAVDGEED